MTFTEVAFTSYPATDLAASRAFYENVLGLKPGMVLPMGEGKGWIEYELGSHTFGIGKADGWDHKNAPRRRSFSSSTGTGTMRGLPRNSFPSSSCGRRRSSSFPKGFRGPRRLIRVANGAAGSMNRENSTTAT